MKLLSRTILTVMAAAGVGIASLVVATPASANESGSPHSSHTVYVAPSNSYSSLHSEKGWRGGSSCQRPDYTNIQAAIEGVDPAGTVIVCRGKYPGAVNVDKRITLVGQPGAVIDATNDPYGVGVSASWSTVTGLTVTNASPLDPDNGMLADGIVTAAFGPQGPVAADHVRIVHNVVTGNLGSGIDINSSSYSTASYNYAHDNGVGINLADDLNLPANHNTVTLNVTDENFGGCGIALADHSGAGVTYNVVAFNTSDDNGLATATAPDASAGSGVILASPIPGGVVKGNSIAFNEFHGNGHGGVVVHAHSPGTDFSGNSVTFNWIGTNNLRTDENDLQTTAVYLGSVSPLSIRVAFNLIGPDYYGIFASGAVTVTGGPNFYVGVTRPLGTAPSF
jgi:parallel beta-helix repeat protein